nr:MAG TPA: hypothetical protein [Caudoviricetes sp.]
MPVENVYNYIFSFFKISSTFVTANISSYKFQSFIILSLCLNI